MRSDVHLTLLVDNLADAELVAEHGFAAWIEAGDQCILLDTGAGTALLLNAGRLRVDLSCASAVVLSHGHYDHTGGLAGFLSLDDKADIYFGPAAECSRYSRHPDRPVRSIGMTAEARAALRTLPTSQLHELREPHRLANGIGITGPIPRECPFEDTGGPFFLDEDGRQTDSIEDDQALWFDTTEGLVVVVGCCHAGIINTVDHVRRITGKERVRGIVGGLHLVNASGDRLEKTLVELRGLDLEFLIPCHCTGRPAIEKLRAGLGGDVVKAGWAGMTVELGRLG